MDFLAWDELAVAAVSLLVGAVVLGTAGFGMGMTSVPVMLLVIEPETVVVTMNTVALMMYVLVLYHTRSSLPIREMTPITLAGLAAVPFGIFFLSTADASLLRISITIVILLLAVVAILNVQRPFPKPGLAGPAIGFAVGVMLVTLGIGGPLLVLFLLAKGTLRQALRAAMAYYFLLVEAVGVTGYAAAGLFTAERVTLVMVGAVPVLIGYWISTLLVHRLNEDAFRHVVIAVIIATSVMVLGREAIRL